MGWKYQGDIIYTYKIIYIYIYTIYTYTYIYTIYVYIYIHIYIIMMNDTLIVYSYLCKGISLVISDTCGKPKFIHHPQPFSFFVMLW